MWNEVLVSFLKKSFSIRCLLVVNNVSLHKKNFGMRHLAESHTVKNVTLGRTSDNFKDFVKLMLMSVSHQLIEMPLVIMWGILGFNANVFCYYILYRYRLLDARKRGIVKIEVQVAFKQVSLQWQITSMIRFSPEKVIFSKAVVP